MAVDSMLPSNIHAIQGCAATMSAKLITKFTIIYDDWFLILEYFAAYRSVVNHNLHTFQYLERWETHLTV